MDRYKNASVVGESDVGSTEHDEELLIVLGDGVVLENSFLDDLQWDFVIDVDVYRAEDESGVELADVVQEGVFRQVLAETDLAQVEDLVFGESAVLVDVGGLEEEVDFVLQGLGLQVDHETQELFPVEVAAVLLVDRLELSPDDLLGLDTYLVDPVLESVVVHSFLYLVVAAGVAHRGH